MDGSGRVTVRNRRFLRKVTPYQQQQPVQRVQVQPDPEEGAGQTGAQQAQGDRAVDRVIRVDQEQTPQESDLVDRGTESSNVEAAEMLEQPVETAGAVVEERATVQEPRRSGRARRMNMKYNPDIYDLARD